MRILRWTLCSLSLLVCGANPAWAIAQAAKSDPAEKAAPVDRQSSPDISISIDQAKIIEILRREPGLTFTVKKMLADAALQEGRLLDDTSFPDSTLYYLIQTDDNIRAMVTSELIRRRYILVQPTEQEANDEYLRQRQLQAELSRTAHDHEQDQGRFYSASDPEKSIRPSDQCEPAERDSTGRCVSGVQNNRGAQGNAAPDPSRDPGPQPTPIQATDLPMLLARSGMASGALSGMPSSATAAMVGSAPQPVLASEREVLNPPNPQNGANRKPAISTGQRADNDATPQDEVVLKRKASPYDSVPSLVDLYSQVDRRYENITRFGTSLFNGTSDALKEQLPMDMPAGPDYVVGPGDGLNVEIWGSSAAQRIQRIVDREGRLSLPEAGLVEVSGKSLSQVQQLVQGALRREFRSIQADVSLARLRTVRIYVVGDIKNPGAYDVSALSTPLNAVLAAGGPGAQGSFRNFRHYRGKQLIQEIDSYDLILNGVRGDIKPLQSGDTVLVPPVGSEVTIEGMVRRPAIYELKTEKTLAQVLGLAGGVLPAGTLRHVNVERIQAHEARTMLSLDIPDNADNDATTLAFNKFTVQNGDKIRISPIVPYSEKTVFLDGHVFRPGKYPFRDDMKVTDLIKSSDDVLPEPARQYAEIIRLNPPDFRPVILAFNLGNVLDKKGNTGPALQPFDTVRVFSRFDFEDPPVVVVNGEVRHPGSHRTNGDLTLRDAIYLAGGLTPNADLGDAQVFRNTQGKAEFFNVNLARALDGDPAANMHLLPRDRIFVHRSLIKVDPPSVNIRGEVATPGRFLLTPGMTVSHLIQISGGFKRGAYTEKADLERYVVDQGRPVSGTHREIDLAAALTDTSADVLLKDGDVLTIREMNGFNDIGASVSVRGEVLYAGTYGISSGERLSSVLRRAGGFSPLAYPYGIVLTRETLRKMEEQSRAQLVQQLQQEVSAGKNLPDSQLAQRQAMLQANQAIQKLQATPALGRQSIRVSRDISRWANTADDVLLQRGDTIVVPKKPDFVLVTGQVYNPNALTYVPGRDVGWYLRRAGGVTEFGNAKRVYVIRADGSLFSRTSTYWFHGDVMGYTLQAGDTIVVPDRVVGTNTLKVFTDAATLISSLAVAARVAVSF
jgi:protein involved in polysaccharide export with SLBB domain